MAAFEWIRAYMHQKLCVSSIGVQSNLVFTYILENDAANAMCDEDNRPIISLENTSELPIYLVSKGDD